MAQQTLTRPNGSQVRITATKMYGAGLTPSIDVQVHHRANLRYKWKLASKEPHKDWRTMSVMEYVAKGKPEALQLASHAEILKVSKLAWEGV